ncbi:MAG: multiprotein bridging factor aMBF1 [Candidatus Bathyarchaeia archaeon]
MQCEVCGKQIIGKPYKAIIEGAKLTVCNKCAKLGSRSWEEETQPKGKKTAKPLPTHRILTKKPSVNITEPTLELIDGFGQIIRQAREKLGLRHEDLGKKINEKVSVLKKIESQKMIPDHALATKLEHALKIKLLVPSSEPKPPQKVMAPPPKVTLGDIINLKDKEEKKERGQ